MKIWMYSIAGMLCVTVLPVAAQSGLSRANAVDRPESLSNTNARITNYGVQVQTVDANGKPFKTPAYQAQGSPFYIDTWSFANLLLTAGTLHNRVSVRLNLLDQTLHFIDKKGMEVYLDAADLQRVELMPDSTMKDTVSGVFKTFITQRTGQPKAAFYQVLAEGSITLLKQTNKKIVANKNEFTQDVTKEIVEYTEYYVYKDNVMEAVKRKAAFWEKLMQDKWKTVETYISKQEIGFRSYDDLHKIVRYYNSL